MNTPSMDRAGNTLESTRKMAGEAMDRAGERMRDIGYAARGLGHRGMDSVSEGAATAQRYVGRYASATTRYVAEQPLKSAMIAAAVGAAVAAVVMVMRSQRRSRYTRF